MSGKVKKALQAPGSGNKTILKRKKNQETWEIQIKKPD
jgi:hypothetical protein